LELIFSYDMGVQWTACPGGEAVHGGMQQART